MVITDEVIERFFQDKCSATEVDAVIVYLDEHPDIAEKYLGDADWNEFKSSITLHPAVSQKMFSVVRKATFDRTSKTKWLRYVAAACVVGLVVLGIRYFTIDKSVDENISVAEVTKNVVTPLHVVRNDTKKVKQILLQDSSVVVLNPASELSYYEPFESNKRRLFLKGEAYFKVAKDKTKPFTVFSGDIATTALGTAFRVNAFEKSNTISVKLFEGKVVIGLANKANKNWVKDFYLLPGDEFQYNKKTLTANVLIPSKSGKSVNAVAITKADNAENWFMFNNQNLADVLEQLSAIYAVKIKYNKKDIAKMSFIGKITKQDSITTVLNDIALLNNLLVIKTGNGYTITKK